MYIPLFIYIAGLIIGLGAVTVIDIHGFLGRKSRYWTIATTRAHKVTKPLIWLGTILSLLGGTWFYKMQNPQMIFVHLVIFSLLILNGLFLTFGVSRFLLKREKNSEDGNLLPDWWQKRIIISFVFSFIGWWGSVALLVYNLI